LLLGTHPGYERRQRSTYA